VSINQPITTMFGKFFDEKKKKHSKQSDASSEKPPDNTATTTSSHVQKKKHLHLKHSPSSPASRTTSGQQNKHGAASRRTKNKRTHDTTNQQPEPHNNHQRKRQRIGDTRTQRPSQEALDLSQQLQELSRQKKFAQAIDLYYHEKYNTIRDSHHACIVVDCCSRCGNIEEAEKVLALVKRNGKPVNMFTHTALLKGYGLSGNMYKAMRLFRDLCQSSDAPNVRTLNTLLRGCLWTASVRVANSSEMVGGVVSSEEAWSLYRQKFGVDQFDSSSYEYAIVLLCQAQMVDAAVDRIGEFMTKYDIRTKGKASFIVDDKSVMETVALVHLSLARAYALRGSSEACWSACQRTLCAVKMAMTYYGHGHQSESENVNVNNHNANNHHHHAAGGGDNKGSVKRRVAQGGKRAWKSSNDVDSRRTASNLAYRGHRLSEIEMEAKALLKSRTKNASVDGEALREMVWRYFPRYLYFSGGGTTVVSSSSSSSASHETNRNVNVNVNVNAKANVKKDEKATLSKRDVVQLLQSTWISFGFSHLIGTGTSAGSRQDDETTCMGSSVSCIEKKFESSPTTTTLPITSSGTLSLANIFECDSNPLDIELGAGYGDWIVRQAEAFPHRNHLAVELRADRIYSTMCKAVLYSQKKSLTNIAVVGDNVYDFLTLRLERCTASTIFVNHPEPPTQTFGDDVECLHAIARGGGDEPVHMLSSASIVAASDCLKRDGRIVIVTDNKWYGRLLCATFSKVMLAHKNMYRSASVNELNNFGLKVVDKSMHPVFLAEGRPNEKIGHVRLSANEGASYFDRLWKTGAGGHAEMTSRFVIVLVRL
jgi:pentatricopeptide repeat protein